LRELRQSGQLRRRLRRRGRDGLGGRRHRPDPVGVDPGGAPGTSVGLGGGVVGVVVGVGSGVGVGVVVVVVVVVVVNSGSLGRRTLVRGTHV
jgi:hypothetical protein